MVHIDAAVVTNTSTIEGQYSEVKKEISSLTEEMDDLRKSREKTKEMKEKNMKRIIDSLESMILFWETVSELTELTQNITD